MCGNQNKPDCKITNMHISVLHLFSMSLKKIFSQPKDNVCFLYYGQHYKVWIAQILAHCNIFFPMYTILITWKKHEFEKNNELFIIIVSLWRVLSWKIIYCQQYEELLIDVLIICLNFSHDKMKPLWLALFNILSETLFTNWVTMF